MKNRPAHANAHSAPNGVVYLDQTQAIAEGMKARDEKALAALFDLYAPYIQKILARILGAGHLDLEDCLQETFITAFNKADQLKEAHYLKTWLTRIAIHRALDQLRKRKRDSWLQFFAPESLPPVAISPYRLEDTEALAAVYAILERMCAKERVVFTLRHLEKMTIPEVAVACDISEATVKRRLTSAGQRFDKLAQATPALEFWLSNQGLRRK